MEMDFRFREPKNSLAGLSVNQKNPVKPVYFRSKLRLPMSESSKSKLWCSAGFLVRLVLVTTLCFFPYMWLLPAPAGLRFGNDGIRGHFILLGLLITGLQGAARFENRH